MKKLRNMSIFILLIALLLSSCSGQTQDTVPDRQSSEAVQPETTAEQIPETEETEILLVEDGAVRYKIVRPDMSGDSVTQAGVDMRNALKAATGLSVTLTTDWFQGYIKGETCENSDYEIIIGDTNRLESKTVKAELEADKFAIKKIGSKIVIVGVDNTSTVDAVNTFIATYIDGKTELLSLPLDIDRVYDRITPLPKISDAVDEHIFLAEQVSDKVTQPAPGIQYHEVLYKNKSGQPVRAYLAILEKGSCSLYTGSPEDGYVFTNKRATVTEEMKSAVANGKNVIIGINADFFAIDDDYVPRGYAVKEGVLLRESPSRPFFAVLEDGTPKILYGSEYSKYASAIRTAVGGSNILLVNSKPSNLDLGKEFGDTTHPRTAVGYDKDGNIYLLVVDGRQTQISNGASLADLAWIFLSFGASDAINLDGGGSSTFVIRDSANDKYSVKNSPSDSSQRMIADSLLVVLN